MQQFFPYPFAFRNSDGTAAALTTSPVCSVYWSSSGSPPYNQSSIGVQIDPVSGTITTVSPTSLVYGGGVVTPPTDVQVFLPVANGSLQVQSPSAGGYAGTLYTVEGVQRTKTVTVREWRDYSLSANMQAYSDQLFMRTLQRRRRGHDRLPGVGHDVSSTRPGGLDHGQLLHDRL